MERVRPDENRRVERKEEESATVRSRCDLGLLNVDGRRKITAKLTSEISNFHTLESDDRLIRRVVVLGGLSPEGQTAGELGSIDDGEFSFCDLQVENGIDRKETKGDRLSSSSRRSHEQKRRSREAEEMNEQVSD